jgi:hypothetical protein
MPRKGTNSGAVEGRVPLKIILPSIEGEGRVFRSGRLRFAMSLSLSLSLSLSRGDTAFAQPLLLRFLFLG